MILAMGKFSPAAPLARARMHQIMALLDTILSACDVNLIVIQRLIGVRSDRPMRLR